MIYGLYLSAAGVVTSGYRQDVIANNLANSETVGFKRDIPLFKERLTEAQQQRLSGQTQGWSDPLLEQIGGGTFATPTLVDSSQGEFEHTGSPLDVAIDGNGYFAVKGEKGTSQSLTRDGRFMVDGEGRLVLSNSSGQRVLDPTGKSIQITNPSPITIGRDGTITQNGTVVAHVGVFDVPDRTKLAKQGGDLLSYPNSEAISAIPANLRGEYVERANVDPTTELTNLMDAQRQLEANANMIRYQDQTLQRLIDVGKIS